MGTAGHLAAFARTRRHLLWVCAWLVGTNPSVGYYRGSSPDNRRFFADVFHWSGREQHVLLSNRELFARIHKGEGELFLWLVNPTRQDQTTEVSFGSSLGNVRPHESVWPAVTPSSSGSFNVGARDVLILRLRSHK